MGKGRAAARASSDLDAVQLSMFETPVERMRSRLASPQPVDRTSTLDIARWWFKSHLELHSHPPNTVSAYDNDLSILQSAVGVRPVGEITSKDIKAYLESARRTSTRKRRLTSTREFFAYLVEELKVLTDDPTEPFFPDRIHLKTPVPLFVPERIALFEAARKAGPGSFLAVYFMLELGINRTELLALNRGHIDASNPDAPVVYVQYDNPRWRHKERTLLGDSRLTESWREYEPTLADDRLYPYRPQVVNEMIHRLSRKADLKRNVTPQSLRDTFGVEQARAGKGVDELLAVLGLASDPRNRDSVRRYIKLAQPPAEVIHDGTS